MPKLIANVDFALEMKQGEDFSDAAQRLYELLSSIHGQGLAELTFDIIYINEC